MNTQTVLPLSLNGDTFNALKSDFDSILRNTLSNMELKGADAAEMNVKLKISLEKEQTRDFEAAYDGAMRDIVKPKFDHAVQSVLQIKDKKDGTLSGNYELVWDADEHKYVMREITNGQMSFDDMPGDIINSRNFVDAEYTDVEDGAAALEGHKIAQLPAPSDADSDENTPEPECEEDAAEEFVEVEEEICIDEDNDGENDGYGYEEPTEEVGDEIA